MIILSYYLLKTGEWGKDRWIPTFRKGISLKWKPSNLVQLLNSRQRFFYYEDNCNVKWNPLINYK